LKPIKKELVRDGILKRHKSEHYKSKIISRIKGVVIRKEIKIERKKIELINQRKD